MSDDGVDYGPLTGLIGTWKGDRGMDIAPEPDGTEESPYYETIVFEAAGDVTNAESQVLAIVRYHQVVSRKSNDQVFHDQIGYWTWDPRDRVVTQSLVIPRAVGALAGCRYEGPTSGKRIEIEVTAAADSPDWGILQSPFMRDNARTLSFRHKVSLDGDTLRYAESTMLEIYGRKFEHTDTNELQRVG